MFTYKINQQQITNFLDSTCSTLVNNITQYLSYMLTSMINMQLLTAQTIVF